MTLTATRHTMSNEITKVVNYLESCNAHDYGKLVRELEAETATAAAATGLDVYGRDPNVAIILTHGIGSHPWYAGPVKSITEAFAWVLGNLSGDVYRAWNKVVN